MMAEVPKSHSKKTIFALNGVIQKLYHTVKKWESKLTEDGENQKAEQQEKKPAKKPAQRRETTFTANDGRGRYTLEERQQKKEHRKLKKQKKKQQAERLQTLLKKIENEKRKKAAVRKSAKLELAIVSIRTTWNNTIISLTDSRGRVQLWTSAGSQRKTRGCKKRSGYANSMAADEVLSFARRKRVKRLGIVLTGPGTGRKWVVKKFIRARTWRVLKIRSKRNIPHGGCRPPKRPRRRRRGFKG